MKRIRSCRSGVLFLLTLAVSFPLLAQSGSTDQGSIRRRSVEWMDALTRGDRQTLEGILDEDFRIEGTDRYRARIRDGRANWFRIALEVAKWESHGYRDMVADVWGDTAVVSSDLSFSVGLRRGLFSFLPAVSTQARQIDVWRRQPDGQWKVIRRFAGQWGAMQWFDRIAGFLVGAIAMLALAAVRKAIRRRRVSS